MAEIKQSFTVNHNRSVVWDMFQDLPKVVSCIPGASLSEPPVDGVAKGRISVKLGPIKADFGGEAKVEPNPADFTGTITGAGVDKNQNSRAKGVVTYTLIELEGGARTQVDVAVDYTLSGGLAQFARGGIVEAVAGQIISDFTENLEAEIEAANPAPVAAVTASAEAGTSGAAAAVAAPAAAPAPAKAKPRELNMFALLMTVLGNKLRSLFGGKTQP